MMAKSLEIILAGIIIGILIGLYCKSSIAFFIMLILVLCFVIQKNRVIKQYFKVFKVKYIIIFFLIAMVVSYGLICLMEKQYEDRASQMRIEENYIVKIISSPIEKEYFNQYIAKIKKIGNQKANTRVYINVKKEKKLNYGEYIVIKGEYKEPSVSRNDKGFNYKIYLKSIGIQGSIQVKSIEKIENKNEVSILKSINQIENKMKYEIESKIKNDTHQSLLLGILLGKDEKLENSVKEEFQESSLSHILAVSGMHISYIMIGIEFILSKTKLNRKFSKIVTIFMILFFMFLTGNTASVQRACIMTIVSIFSTLVYRKNNIYHSMVISLLLILLQNPYSILNTGVILSYSATLGIVIFYKKISKALLKRFVKTDKETNLKKVEQTKQIVKIDKVKSIERIKKILQKIKLGTIELISVSLAVQVILLPINLICFQNLSITFLFSNLAVSFLIGVIMLLGFLISIPITIPLLTFAITFFLEFLLNILLSVSSFFSQMSFSHIYLIPPSIFVVFIYYAILISCISYIKFKKKESKRRFEKALLTIVENFKWTIINKKRIIIIGMIIIITIGSFVKQIPKDLEIHFLDVGQGDCSLIVTPNNKTVLIDGGGNTNEEEFDVGKRTVLPYLLSHKIRTIDVVCISHFDADHCNGIKALIENVHIKTILITKQVNQSKEYSEIVEMIKKKKIDVKIVKQGDKIQIDKEVVLNILYPGLDTKLEGLNNNSMVVRLEYKKFSMLFTGDIEKEAEQELVQKYKNTNKLETMVLKVAHHGSKSSSTETFLNMVHPKIAFIGVGENNKFGHPNTNVIKRFENRNMKIYRTDQDGEITIIVNRNGRVWIDKMLN